MGGRASDICGGTARGVTHDTHFAAIGITAALGSADRLDLRPRLQRFCAGYGLAFQLLDDIAEAHADAAAGYHSFPIMEGPPYAQSFEQAQRHLDAAESVLHPRWRRLRQLVRRVRAAAKRRAHASNAA